MRVKTGILCMVLGTALIFGALLLFIRNEKEAKLAEQEVQAILPELISEIQARRQEQTPYTLPPAATALPLPCPETEAAEMSETVIDGHAYIGCISVPAIKLELPVMADWDYNKLEISPCRYNGSVRGGDLVIMAHNYDAHFGRLSQLSEGDSVVFTDADGISTGYVVVGRDVLDPYAVAELVAGDYDLTLFTCTYGGASRITVYCDKTE